MSGKDKPTDEAVDGAGVATSAAAEAGPPAPSEYASPSQYEVVRDRHRKPKLPPPPGVVRLYIPTYGYIDAGDEERVRVDDLFNVPMIVLALLTLPLLAAEHFLGPDSLDKPVLQFVMQAALGFIWLAFLVEFVVKISIAPSRVKYATQNWVDIVIILLPMLRVFRAARIIRAGRAVKVARAARLYRLRGLGLKLFRTGLPLILSLSFVKRIRQRFQNPDSKPSRPSYEQWEKSALISEIDRLNRQLDDTKTELYRMQMRLNRERRKRKDAASGSTEVSSDSDCDVDSGSVLSDVPASRCTGETPA